MRSEERCLSPGRPEAASYGALRPIAAKGASGGVSPRCARSHVARTRGRALLLRALADDDPEVVGAAVRALGEVGEEWAVDELIGVLRAGTHSRSRVATQLDRLTPRIGPKLVGLVADDDPTVRFWAATLLGRCSGSRRDTSSS